MTYTVNTRDGCTLITGAMPADHLVALTRTAGDGAVLSADLAQLAGVQFAWGDPTNVDALTARLRAERLADLAAAKQQGAPLHGDLSDAARRWLAVGEQGLSSCSMFWRLTGVKPDYIGDQRHYDHPHDPDDLRRCLLLLDQVPEFKGRVREMIGCSREWGALAQAWDDLVATLESEIPEWRNPPAGSSARVTYDKMAAILRTRDGGAS